MTSYVLGLYCQILSIFTTFKNKKKMSKPVIQKITKTDFPILESIKDRWSPRMFADTPITEEQVKILLEAGRWAPSAANIQPWRIIWGIKGTEMFERIYSCLDDWNQQWAHNSQVLWLNCYKTQMGRTTQKENRHAIHDVGLFMGNVLHQASSMNIAVHQMAGVLFDKARKEFKIPKGYDIATAVAFGYFGGDASKLPEDMRKSEVAQERIRISQDEFAYNGDFKEND